MLLCSLWPNGGCVLKSFEKAHSTAISISSTMSSLCLSFSMLILLFLVFKSSSSAHSFRDDRQSLLAFKQLIANDPHHSMGDWSPAIPFCNWTAVTCSRRHPNRVVALDLTLMELDGSISPSLGNLSFLRSLVLSGNELHGHIPTQLGQLFRLQTLWLDTNRLEGSIPSELSGCRNLVSLALSVNGLSGSIPPELGSLVRLQEIALGMNNLTGIIPPSLGNLSNLIRVDISSNNLVGAIPSELGLLTSLQLLHLFHNELSGSIPSSLSNMSSLTRLVISRNKLNGSIPHELGLLPSLQIFYLHTNELSGTIPSSLSNISTMIDFEISRNKLTGSIPQSLGFFPNLQGLYLNENKLSGAIPISISNISTLIELSIYVNKLSGIIPRELGLLNNLQRLHLHTNELSGIIPTSLSNLFNLRELFLWGNQLSGNIPNSIGNCSKLQYLHLDSNKLSGSVPVELGMLSILKELGLSSNQLDSGSAITMPFLVALTNCSRLRKLTLSNNKLRGVLPIAIGELSLNLSYLSLSNNKIQGNIPPHIGNLSSLTFLNLSGNLLNGSIPPLGNLRKLERLYLGDNRLGGNIPDDFEQLQHLGLLDISKNKLSGKIPNSLAPLKQLRRLLLHHNHLSGSIPANLGDCINLELLDLSHNMLTGTIPREMLELSNIHFYLDLSWNLLEGSLPKEIGKIAMAQAIDISANQLIGVIPTTLGSCTELESLNLSRNSFHGSIPDSLGTLQNLMNLDLSSNSLSGTIPNTLKNLKMLQYLNLSFNNLMGEIPIGGIFANRTIVMSLFGNPSLCGPQVFGLPKCPTPKGHFAFAKKILFLVGGVVALILCCLLWKFLWRGNLQIQNSDFSQDISQKLQHQRISYQELQRATNKFAMANLLGEGSYGLVYKGILSDGTPVAVKVLQLQNAQVEKSFKAECSVLQKVRHRNLVRIITSCSNDHFKGLVFRFMSNGSLEKQLYHDKDGNNNEDACELGLKTRLDISIDVAHAMEYLHHYAHDQVVHCDLKPSNVLLDEDMTGHVTDFGIARLIGATSSDSLTSTLALKGSVGYIAPEYGLGQSVSTKGDVYSYGILLLEIFTRKRPTSNMFSADQNFHQWVNLAFPNKLKEVIDNGLFSEVDGDELEENNVYKVLLSLLRVGLICSKDSPEERPTMRDVVMVLEGLREDLVANTVASRRLGQSVSNLLMRQAALRNDAPTSID